MATPPITVSAEAASRADLSSGEFDCWSSAQLAAAFGICAETARRRAGKIWPAIQTPAGPRFPLAWVRALFAVANAFGTVNADSHGKAWIEANRAALAASQPAGGQP